MADYLQDLDLSCDTFDVRLVLNFVLFEYFDSDLLPSEGVCAEPDLPEGALTQGLT
jgi:hypothetical protein